MKSKVRVKFANGLSASEMLTEALWVVNDRFEFVEDDNNPEFLIFGPYGLPPSPGSYTRVGYYCENKWPNLEACDWAFGVPYEELIDNDKYCRIEWHNIRPSDLVKDISAMRTRPMPKRFCNFVFSNPVEFRESFFRALSRYKHVDAPGQSMNNQKSFDADTTESNRWIRKRHYLSNYKFTVAFENESSPGYNTEKLTDAMLAGSIPIYFGNPQISRHFNTKSFINSHEYLPCRRNFIVRSVDALSCEVYGRRDKLPLRAQPRFRKLMRVLKSRLQYGFDFSRLIDRIVEVDQNEEEYRSMLSEPFVDGNIPPSVERVRQHWIRIFTSPISRGSSR